ncbi:kinase-like domain-containing protein, partial [Xylogone sp. PMI_703]
AIGGLAADARREAFARETEAFNTSISKVTYDAACEVPKEYTSIKDQDISRPESPGITIGPYSNCHHVESGLISEIYKVDNLALKVITETRNIEPHNPSREVKLLTRLRHESIIQFVDSCRDAEGRLVLVFPFIPLTLQSLLSSDKAHKGLPISSTKRFFKNILSGLQYLHHQGIIHRDIKPSNVLLASPTGPAYISDFGTAWDPELSIVDEPIDHKVLEVGTTCYRAPETLFGNRSYGTCLDMWSAGVMLAECLRTPPSPLFESRDSSEDGNQLGLILSIFKTIGTPTKETWPEAVDFSTPPFEWYQEFPSKSWEILLPGVDEVPRSLVTELVRYESRERYTAEQALKHPFFS